MEVGIDEDEGNRTKSALDGIGTCWDGPLEADVANKGYGEGCNADLGVGVDKFNENRTEEG